MSKAPLIIAGVAVFAVAAYMVVNPSNTPQRAAEREHEKFKQCIELCHKSFGAREWQEKTLNLCVTKCG